MGKWCKILLSIILLIFVSVCFYSTYSTDNRWYAPLFLVIIVFIFNFLFSLFIPVLNQRKKNNCGTKNKLKYIPIIVLAVIFLYIFNFADITQVLKKKIALCVIISYSIFLIVGTIYRYSKSKR